MSREFRCARTLVLSLLLAPLRRVARGIGLSLVVGLIGFAGHVSVAFAQGKYLPDAPLVPTISLNEGACGAACLPALHPPAPNAWDQESSWNIKQVGWANDLGCENSDQMWVEHQGERYILYVGAATATVFNPLTRQMEPCGVVLYDVTKPKKPVFLSMIDGTADGSGRPHVFVCSGNTLPKATKGHYYLLTHEGNLATGSGKQQIYDVTDPSAPYLLTTIVTGLSEYHRSYWECDTGIAYVIAGGKADGWRQGQHVYIYNLADPAKPVFIRQWGLPGGQPSSASSWTSCTNSPGADCFEGVSNPPAAVHQCYSTSTGVVGAGGIKRSVVICSIGVGASGVMQIVDRTKLLNGCNPADNPAASANCANTPTESAGPSQADLLYPQIGYIASPPYIGMHGDMPIFNIPIPTTQGKGNYPDLPSPLITSPSTGAGVTTTTTTLGTQHWDLEIESSEAGGPPSCGTSDNYMHNATILDITNELTPWPISTLNVATQPGDFCQKGGRFGAHFVGWEIYAPYYGKLQFVTWFNAGLRAWDIRDPYNPRAVGYFIQAPNSLTQASCGVPGDPTLCRNVPFMDTVQVDDRGYVYGEDRYGSGVTIMLPTGDALDAVKGEGRSDYGDAN
ncbi:MAG: hypothetical protein WAU56_12845 [Steroidobacteraceae bacterium]